MVAADAREYCDISLRHWGVYMEPDDSADWVDLLHLVIGDLLALNWTCGDDNVWRTVTEIVKEEEEDDEEDKEQTGRGRWGLYATWFVASLEEGEGSSPTITLAFTLEEALNALCESHNCTDPSVREQVHAELRLFIQSFFMLPSATAAAPHRPPRWAVRRSPVIRLAREALHAPSASAPPARACAYCPCA